MFRVLLEMITAVGGITTLFGFWYRQMYLPRRAKPESNIEHVRRLEQENKEIDEINQRITKGKG
jgi:hypothetical protein